MDKNLGSFLDDRYEMLEVIGSGGMAIVYRAMCHRLNRHVAIKVLREDMAKDSHFKNRFETEAQAVAMLSHPNIVAVYDVSHSDGLDYFVMELIEGITLKQYMQRKGALAWKEALHFCVQISKAIEHAHSKGIVHRDIKPQNIMILKDGTIKVADFGIAALESEVHAASDETYGSVHYIAPEQAKGEAPDARIDIYSLGVVMYEMLTGKLPYDGKTSKEITLQHISGTAKLPREINSGIPQELERICMRAMNADKAARYQSVTEFLRDLEGFRAQQVTAQVAAVPVSQNTEYIAYEPEEIVPDVYPISRAGEMSKEDYKRRKRRASKVAILSGIVGVVVFIVALFVFLWNFWLGDIFRVEDRISVDNFIGLDIDAVVNDTGNSEYNFRVVFTIDPDVPEGTIIGQHPESGRSMMLMPEGIDIELTVSTGVVLTTIPDVSNWQYQEAILELQRQNFVVEQTREASDGVTKDYVISTSPAAGEQAAAGSTVFLVISGGPVIDEVEMPNLIGRTESSATSMIDTAGLSFGGATYVESEFEVGTVFRQSVDPYTMVEEHTNIYIWVSTGPKETPTPTPEPTDEIYDPTPNVPEPTEEIE